MYLVRVFVCFFICWLGSALAARKAPVHPVVLQSSQLQLTLDGDDALPYEYRLSSNGAVIHGEAAGRPITATVREDDGAGWLAHGDQGGNLILLSQAKPGHLSPNRFWGGVAATLPVVMIGTSKALCVQEVKAFMDTTELAVEGDAGQRSAELGTISVYRVNGSLAYDMNANPGKPLIAGNKKTPNLLVGQRPLARLDFAGDYDGNGLVDWLDGAKLVRARMPEIPTHYYNGKAAFSSLAQGLGPRSDHGPRTLCG